MNIAIIEDEVQTARDLQRAIIALRQDASVKVILDSVETAVEWLSANEPLDLIFSDIQLGDGLAFEIFKKVDVQCPVIFCTAYDEYALLAFQNNGIDYLLKPIDEITLEKSLSKIDRLAKPLHKDYARLVQEVIEEVQKQTKNYKSNFLVAYRDKLIPIRAEDAAIISLKDDHVYLFTIDNKQYPLMYTLDQLEALLDPKQFFRANRQNLVNYKAIREVEHFLSRKLLIKLTVSVLESVTVSKAKATDFLRWMELR